MVKIIKRKRVGALEYVLKLFPGGTYIITKCNTKITGKLAYRNPTIKATQDKVEVLKFFKEL